MSPDPQWVEPEPPQAWGPGLVRVASLSATPSPGFVAWLRDSRLNLVIATGDRVATLGVEDDALVLFEHGAELAMGLATVDDGAILLSTRWQIHRLHPALDGPSSTRSRYFNQHSRTIGFVGAYDLAVDRRGRVLFSTSLCNGVATLSPTYNFDVVARPPFVSQWIAEERCHVTGLALDERGELAYLTCAAQTDEAGGWHERVADGGAVVDVRAGRVLRGGLSLPNSPRVVDGRLYVANGGTGELLRINRSTGRSTTVTAVPGLARGMTVHGRWAILGCSNPPPEGPYVGLPIAETLSASGREARHGLVVIDLETGAQQHAVTLAAGSGEVRSVAAVAGSRPVEVFLDPARHEGWFSLKPPPD